MKKIYMILAAITLLSMSLNAQLLPSAQKYKAINKAQISGQDKGQPAQSNGALRAPYRYNAADGEFLVGPYTTDDFGTTGKGLYSSTYSYPYGRVDITAILDRSEIEQYIGQQIVGYRFATTGTVSCYSFIVSTEGPNHWVNDIHEFNLQSSGAYVDVSGTQWHEYYLDEPVTFEVPDSVIAVWVGYKYYQETSSSGGYSMTPILVNPNSTSHTTYAYSYSNQAFYDVTSTLGGDLAAQLIFKSEIPTPELTAPENGSTVNVGTNEGSGVSTTINVSGNDLTENLTVSVSGTGFSVTPATISAADANAGTTVTVTYNGTDPNATGTLTISSGEVSATVNLTASYIQVIPTVAISPATQTINDAAAGALTVTGTNIDGNINVSAANDWSLSSTSLSNTGGQVSVSYTGRALSANTTVTASATGATDATATVNYVADLYIVTDNGVTDQWDFNNGTHMTYDPNTGTYTATFTANNADTYILFARKLGNDVNWNTRYVFGPDSNGNWWMTGESASGTIDVNDDDPIYFQNAGTYTITINSDGTFTITTGGTPQVPVLITPEDGSTVFVGTTSAELPSVSKEIPISGQYLTKDLTATITGEGFSFLTRDITVPYADVNAATASVTVVYNGTDENATGTLTLSSDEVSATVNLTASYRKPAVLTTVPAGYVVQDKKTPNQIVTAVIETTVDLYHGEVVSVTYVNSLGMTSDKPFEGVNIVITRYSDGTTSTSKVMQ